VKVDPAIVIRIQVTVDDPRNGVKVTAAAIGIGRVTLWRLLTMGKASSMTMRRISRFIETTETPNQKKTRGSLCTLIP
jgi:DNA-binding Xre family transcriptional regulator